MATAEFDGGNHSLMDDFFTKMAICVLHWEHNRFGRFNVLTKKKIWMKTNNIRFINLHGPSGGEKKEFWKFQKKTSLSNHTLPITGRKQPQQIL